MILLRLIGTVNLRTSCSLQFFPYYSSKGLVLIFTPPFCTNLPSYPFHHTSSSRSSHSFSLIPQQSALPLITLYTLHSAHFISLIPSLITPSPSSSPHPLPHHTSSPPPPLTSPHPLSTPHFTPSPVPSSPSHFPSSCRFVTQSDLCGAFVP